MSDRESIFKTSWDKNEIKPLEVHYNERISNYKYFGARNKLPDTTESKSVKVKDPKVENGAMPSVSNETFIGPTELEIFKINQLNASLRHTLKTENLN